MNRSAQFVVALFAAVMCGNLACAQLPPDVERATNLSSATPREGDIDGGFNRPADQPVPRADRNSQTAHEQLLEKSRKGGIDVYFLGESGCSEAARPVARTAVSSIIWDSR
jgi:hypothetical protein